VDRAHPQARELFKRAAGLRWCRAPSGLMCSLRSLRLLPSHGAKDAAAAQPSALGIAAESHVGRVCAGVLGARDAALGCSSLIRQGKEQPERIVFLSVACVRRGMFQACRNRSHSITLVWLAIKVWPGRSCSAAAVSSAGAAQQRADADSSTREGAHRRARSRPQPQDALRCHSLGCLLSCLLLLRICQRWPPSVRSKFMSALLSFSSSLAGFFTWMAINA
jgi:hypothetical protein